MNPPPLLLSRALLVVALAAPVTGCVGPTTPAPEMASLPPPASPPPPMAMNTSQALGLWQSSFGAVKIETDSGQPDRLMGIWLYDRTGQEVIGFFNGALRGNVLEFSWHEPAQPRDLVGAGFLVFEPDGSRFTGTWWTRDQSRTGDWNGWRITQPGARVWQEVPASNQPPPWASESWQEPAPQANPSYGSQDPNPVPPPPPPPPSPY